MYRAVVFAMSAERRWSLAGWTVVLLFAIVAAWTFTDYGITWDESVQREYGERALRYYTSGFRDSGHASLRNLRYYGPLFEMTAAAVAHAVPASPWEVRHALIAATGVLTVIAAMKLAAMAGGGASGFFAALFLVLTPHFYGHSFNNSKDIPFACAVAWTAWMAARLTRSRRWRDALVVAAALGAAMAIRVGGIFLLPIIALGVFASSSRQTVRRDVLQVAAVAAGAWCVMVAFWPWAQQGPLVHPLEALRMSAAFPEAYGTLFEGSVWMSDALPLRYLPEMLAITTPSLILALALLGSIAAAAALRRDAGSRGTRIVIALWLVAPLAIYFLRRPPLYDGIRHVLFILPAIAILAGIGMERLRALRYGAAIAALAIVALLPTAMAMTRLHPYQSTYYNWLVGGVAEASTRYETDYWVSSYREAMSWVNAHACAGETRLLLAANEFSAPAAIAYAAPGVRFTIAMGRDARAELPAPFDYYLATTRYGLAANFPAAPVAAVIGRDGAMFTIVRGRCRSPR